MSIDKQLFLGVQKSIRVQSIAPIIEAIIQIFAGKGIAVHRLQIPMNSYFGFRHPQYVALIVTWKDGVVTEEPIAHTAEDAMERYKAVTATTPFAPLLLQNLSTYRVRLQPEGNPYPILDKMAQEGFQDYVSFAVELPHSVRQLCSIATKASFPDTVEDVIAEMNILLGLSIYSYYQSLVSRAIATTYLGTNTGEKVLQGEMFRGSQRSLDAGILFCDVRGFTALSEKLGAKGVVSVMNMVFECIAQVLEVHQGEILKFIGDAMLVIFHRNGLSDQELGRTLITVAKQSVQNVEALAVEKQLPLAVGFGAHIGEVLYGNIGTAQRLDFTVMGPSVNLASRLESMCKELSASLVVSTQVAQGNEDILSPLGKHSVKGVSGHVDMWGVKIQ